MEILKSAAAGTLESSDCMVTVEPGEGIRLDLSSSVMNQYGRQIKAAVLETLDRLDVKNANVTVGLAVVNGGRGRAGMHAEGPGGMRRAAQL